MKRQWIIVLGVTTIVGAPNDVVARPERSQASRAVQWRDVAPVLEFPEAGMDDSASYQGYRTRLFRDARGNTVQIYLDGRSGRVVHLLADGANESVGLTIRDSAGRPAPLAWNGTSARVADSANTRTIGYDLTARGRNLTIGWPLLGSMRVERDFQYARHHERPFTSRDFSLRELVTLVANLRRLPASERERHLEQLGATTVEQVTQRMTPTLSARASGDAAIVRVEQPSFDGRNRLAIELSVDARRATISADGRVVRVAARDADSVALTLTVSTDAPALTPLRREEMFSPEFLRFLESAREASRSRDTAAMTRHRWLEREVRGVELLSSREKLMAGLPNFATYFGRDMMMSALMMQDVWSNEMLENVVASALRKLSRSGEVSHEEALGGQAIRENADAYNALVASARGNVRDSLLALAREVLGDLQRVRENYRMRDDDFQLPVLAARYLASAQVSAERKRRFLRDTTAQRGESRLTRLVRALAVVVRESAPYASEQRATRLIAFPRLDSTYWFPGSWRDSRAGYGNGRYAMDINAIWVPRALASTAVILDAIDSLGLTPDLERSGADIMGPLRDRAAIRRAVEAWRGAWKHFEIAYPAPIVEQRVTRALAALPVPERRFWSRVASGTPPADSVVFLALSLDARGVPIPVMNTDPATWLFLEERLPADRVTRTLDAMLRSYPVGLYVDGLGPLVANDVYAPSSVREAFRNDTYHSPRVVWGREVNLLLLGLARQIRAAHDSSGRVRDPSLAPYVRSLQDALERIRGAVEASGLKHSELWSYRIEGDRLLPIRYGSSTDVQLWNTTDLAVQYELSRLPARR
jgi:hypothetical protein